MKNLLIDVGNSAIKVSTGNSFSVSVNNTISHSYTGIDFENANFELRNMSN